MLKDITNILNNPKEKEKYLKIQKMKKIKIKYIQIK